MNDKNAELLAQKFWARLLDTPPDYPRDLSLVLPALFPAMICPLPRLTVHSAERWLRGIGAELSLGSEDRALRGCTVAYHGQGVIFLDGADPLLEQRFTLAHEAAHLFMDYFLPLEDTIRAAGQESLDVIFGKREPTERERALAALAGRRFAMFLHLLPRKRSGRLPTEIQTREDDADRLACELLAPAHDVSRVAPSPVATASDIDTALTSYFGLPESIAEPYAAHLARRLRPAPSFVEWLRPSGSRKP
jgi:hypothetical protein